VAQRVTIFFWCWLVLGPGVLIGVVPWWLAHQVGASPAWQGTIRQWIGVWVILNGCGLSAWCASMLIRYGNGTPLPLDPPKRLVIAGPYRFVRNPMALGFFVLLFGQALLYRSWLVCGYLLVLAAGLHLYLLKIEEPELATRFGPAYKEYRRRVPRWLPRPPQ